MVVKMVIPRYAFMDIPKSSKGDSYTKDSKKEDEDKKKKVIKKKKQA